MGKIGVGCCNGDCLTPFTCGTWSGSWSGYTFSLGGSDWVYLVPDTSLDFESSVLTLATSGSFSDARYPGLGTITYSATLSYSYKFIGHKYTRVKRGGILGDNWCLFGSHSPYPIPLWLPEASPDGIATMRGESGSCMASFSATVNHLCNWVLYWKPISITTTWTNGSYFAGTCTRSATTNSARRIALTGSEDGSLTGYQWGTYGAVSHRFRGFNGVFVSPGDAAPYSSLSDLSGSHSLYLSPGRGFFDPLACSLLAPNCFTWDASPSASFALNNVSLDFASCDGSVHTLPQGVAVWPSVSWAEPTATTRSVVMGLTIGSCLTVGESGGET